MPYPRRTRAKRGGGNRTEEEGAPGDQRDSSQSSDPSRIQSNPRSPAPPDHLQSHSDRPSRPSCQEENLRYSPPTSIASSSRSGNPALPVYATLAQIPLSRLRTRIHPAPSPLPPLTSHGHTLPPPGIPQPRGQRGPRGPRTSERARARASVPMPNCPSTGPPLRGGDAGPSEERRTTIDVSMNSTGPDQFPKANPNEPSEGAQDTAGLPGTRGRLGSTSRFGYTADSGDSRVQDDQFRTYSLQLLQHPVRGRALDREPWRTASPPLSPPCVLRLMVRNRVDRLVDVDDTVSLRRIHFMVVSVNLSSADGETDLSVVHFRSKQYSHWGQKKDGLLPGAVDQGLLGERTKTSQIFEIGPENAREKAHLFIFPDLVVRPIGRFTLRFVLSDIGNPSHFTTSTTTSRILDTVFTPAFDTTESWIGPVPTTALTRGLKKQKARGIKGSPVPVGTIVAPERDDRTGDDGNESSNSSSEGGVPSAT